MVKENIQKIRKRISLACSKVNRDPGLITILAVSKGRSLDEVGEVTAAGINDIGENRVQEAVLKHLSYPAARWHMVGHLQANKVKDAVRIFDLIHSVDTLEIAREINKQAAKIGKTQDILIQVNVSGETTKYGFGTDGALEIIQATAALKNLKIKGLMTIAPFTDNPEASRPYFQALKEIKDRINKLKIIDVQLEILSMGMTGDFEVAVEEGATLLRLGRVIFEG